MLLSVLIEKLGLSDAQQTVQRVRERPSCEALTPGGCRPHRLCLLLKRIFSARLLTTAVAACGGSFTGSIAGSFVGSFAGSFTGSVAAVLPLSTLGSGARWGLGSD